MSIGSTDAEAETPILWPPDAKKWLMRKKPWCWQRLKAGREGDNSGWDCWMASQTLPDHLTCLLRNLYAGHEATVRTRHGTTDWFQIGKVVPWHHYHQLTEKKGKYLKSLVALFQIHYFHKKENVMHLSSVQIHLIPSIGQDRMSVSLCLSLWNKKESSEVIWEILNRESSKEHNKYVSFIDVLFLIHQDNNILIDNYFI